MTCSRASGPMGGRRTSTERLSPDLRGCHLRIWKPSQLVTPALAVLATFMFLRGTAAGVPGKLEVERDLGTGLPLCYSSLAADPSEGRWEKLRGGITESPMKFVDWPARHDLPNAGAYYGSCHGKWARGHAAAEIRPYWGWVPANCRLEEVDAAKFCRVMEGRKGILLVGDSITGELASTLASTLRARLTSTGPSGPDKLLACNGTLNIHFYRNDFLDLRLEPANRSVCPGEDGLCFAFADDSIIEASDVIVVNSGAHMMAGGLLSYKENMKAASAWLGSAMNRLHGATSTLIVRNTLPGHWDCDARMFDAPVSISTAANLVAQAPQEYGWTEVANKNKVLRESFEGSGKGWKWLDVYSSTVLRADSHRGHGDCLHYCIPGPIDHWAVLLYHMLLADVADQ